MDYVVTKPFKTETRKFKIGDHVTALDIDGTMTFDDWVSAGFIEPAADVLSAPLNERTVSALRSDD